VADGVLEKRASNMLGKEAGGGPARLWHRRLAEKGGAKGGRQDVTLVNSGKRHRRDGKEEILLKRDCAGRIIKER